MESKTSGEVDTGQIDVAVEIGVAVQVEVVVQVDPVQVDPVQAQIVHLNPYVHLFQ
jgi:hypothetical protein